MKLSLLINNLKMETVFGERLIKYVPAAADKLAQYDAELKAANEAGTDLPEHPS